MTARTTSGERDIALGMLTAERLDAATKVAEIIEQEEAGLDQQWIGEP